MHLLRSFSVSIIPALVACHGSSARVAEVDGQMTLAVVEQEGTTTAYLCGQDDRLADSRWFVGEGRALAPVAPDDPWTLTVEDGAYTLSDGASTWSGAFVDDGAALYDAKPDGCRAGAIVVGDRLVGTWCDGANGWAQVEPIDTFSAADARMNVQAVTSEGTREFTMRRLPWSG